MNSFLWQTYIENLIKKFFFTKIFFILFFFSIKKMESVSTVTPESVSKENKTARTSIIKCPICQKEYKLKLDGNTSVTYQKHVERCKSNYEQFKQLRNKNVKGIENIIQNTNTQSNTQSNSISYNRFNLQSINTLINVIII